MTTQQLIIAAFAVLIFGLMLPVGHGWRSAIFLVLIALTICTFIGGSMDYLLRLF